MFDVTDPAIALSEVDRCRGANPGHYVRVSLYDPTMTRMTTALQFLVHRPPHEPGFRLDRQEVHDRVIRYTLHPYVADRPRGDRYGNGPGS
jgi:ribulose-bisphosphate carboxylase small chain